MVVSFCTSYCGINYVRYRRCKRTISRTHAESCTVHKPWNTARKGKTNDPSSYLKRLQPTTYVRTYVSVLPSYKPSSYSVPFPALQIKYKMIVPKCMLESIASQNCKLHLDVIQCRCVYSSSCIIHYSCFLFSFIC